MLSTTILKRKQRKRKTCATKHYFCFTFFVGTIVIKETFFEHCLFYIIKTWLSTTSFLSCIPFIFYHAINVAYDELELGRKQAMERELDANVESLSMCNIVFDAFYRLQL